MKKTMIQKMVKGAGFFAGLCAALGPSLVFAQGPSSQPSSQPSTQAAGEELSGTIRFVKGDVRVRATATSPWQKAVVGMVIPQGGEIQTGLKSQIDVFMPPAQVLSLDRMTTVKLVELVRNGDKIKSNIGMQYGRTQLNIEKSGMVHDAKISTPSTTLALRGTNVSVYDQAPFAPKAISYTGRADAQFRGRSFDIPFGTNRFTVVTDGNTNPAQESQFETGVNLRPDEGTTTTEQQMVSRYPQFNGTGGGIIGGVTAVNKSTSTPFGRTIDTSGEGGAGGLTFPLPNPTVVDGTLTMSLLSPVGSNVKFTVISPFNEFLSQQFGKGKLGATFTQTTSTEGNMQQVKWTTKYPEGNYILRASGSGVSTGGVPVRFNVQQDGASPVQFNKTLTPARPNVNIDLNIKKGSSGTP
jgi:hypothetical protein